MPARSTPSLRVASSGQGVQATRARTRAHAHARTHTRARARAHTHARHCTFATCCLPLPLRWSFPLRPMTQFLGSWLLWRGSMYAVTHGTRHGEVDLGGAAAGHPFEEMESGAGEEVRGERRKRREERGGRRDHAASGPGGVLEAPAEREPGREDADAAPQDEVTEARRALARGRPPFWPSRDWPTRCATGPGAPVCTIALPCASQPSSWGGSGGGCAGGASRGAACAAAAFLAASAGGCSGGLAEEGRQRPARGVGR